MGDSFLFRYTLKSFSRELLMLAAAAAFLVPVYVMVTLSLKTTEDAYQKPLSFPTSAELSNFSTVWETGGQSGLGTSMFSTALITVVSVIGLIVVGSLCAYAIARRPSKLSTGVYLLFALALILPLQLAVIPMFVAMRDLGLAGTYPGMILIQMGIHMPFVVFLYTGFIRALPREYEEAAYVDGAGLLRTWFRVVFPLLLPVTGTVAILAGLTIWNDFFFSLIFLSGTDKETLPLALYSFVGQNVAQWNLIMAGVLISVTPIIAFYLFAQKQLIRGFAGGIKG